MVFQFAVARSTTWMAPKALRLVNQVWEGAKGAPCSSNRPNCIGPCVVGKAVRSSNQPKPSSQLIKRIIYSVRLWEEYHLKEVRIVDASIKCEVARPKNVVVKKGQILC